MIDPKYKSVSHNKPTPESIRARVLGSYLREAHTHSPFTSSESDVNKWLDNDTFAAVVSVVGSVIILVAIVGFGAYVMSLTGNLNLGNLSCH